MTRSRPAYTTEDVARFMALARGGRDRRDDRAAAMRAHPAGTGQAHGVRHLTGPTPLVDADGTDAERLPAAHPED